MLNILVSYSYMSQNIVNYLLQHKNIKFLLDSGAFTAWKQGTEITVDQYCKFIEDLPVKPWRYFSLDVIGDPEASLRNYEIMRSRGLTPVPIFTRGENLEMVDRYYETSDLLAVGGLVGTKNNRGFVKGIMERIGDRKVHWLGYNQRDFVAHYRPYMCDSSSWAAAVRFASVKLYDRNGRWIPVGKKDFVERPSDEIMNLIESYGIDPTLLAQTAHWKNSGKGEFALEHLTCRSWTKYQIDLKNKLDVNFFLACASDWQVRLLNEANAYWKDKGI